MAFCLVDPTLFIPPNMQRMMIQGRPDMRRVVVGPVTPRNDDLAIVQLDYMSEGDVPFWDIRNIVEDFLRNHV